MRARAPRQALHASVFQRQLAGAPVSRRIFYDAMCCHEDLDEHELGPTPPFCAAFYPMSNVVACGDEEGVIRLIDTSRDREWNIVRRTEFQAHSNAIFDLAWVPGTQRTLTSSGDQTIRLFDVRTQAQLCVYQGHRASVKAVSPADAHIFASGGRDGSVCIWDSRLSEPRPALIIANAHALALPAAAAGAKRRRGGAAAAATPVQSVSSVVFIPGSSAKLATAGATDGAIKLWDLRALRGETGGGSSSSSSSSSAGRSGGGGAAGGGGGGGGSTARATSKARAPAPTLVLRPPCPQQQQQQPPQGGGGSGGGMPARPRGITALAVDASGSRLLATTTSNAVYLYDTRWASDVPPRLLPSRRGGGKASASPASSASSCSGSGTSSSSSSSRAAAAAGEAAVTQFGGHRVDSFYVKTAFSPDGRYIASGSSDCGVYLWEAASPSAPPVVLWGHTSEVTAVAWHPTDETALVSVSDDATMRVWRVDREAGFAQRQLMTRWHEAYRASEASEQLQQQADNHAAEDATDAAAAAADGDGDGGDAGDGDSDADGQGAVPMRTPSPTGERSADPLPPPTAQTAAAARHGAVGGGASSASAASASAAAPPSVPRDIRTWFIRASPAGGPSSS